jgi:hypothetical protein
MKEAAFQDPTLHLASAASDFMTGQTIYLDGGHSIA